MWPNTAGLHFGCISVPVLKPEECLLVVVVFFLCSYPGNCL